jgi:hypothetical protein
VCGERRNSGEVSEEVERGPLAAEQRPRGAGDERDLGGNLAAPLALDDELVERLGADLRERLGCDVEAEEHTG